MPVHDWTRVDAGLFHAFHQRWISALCDALNTGGLPPDYFAFPEQRISGPIPDVLTLKLSLPGKDAGGDTGGVAVAAAPPRTRVTQRLEAQIYAHKTNRITVRHRHGEVVAIIEIVSPGNKANRTHFRTFIEKSADLLVHGVHLLIIDLFPPGPRDPLGVHNAIWSQFEGQVAELPPDKPLILSSYDACEDDPVAYVEAIAVGEPLPDMPIFLRPQHYVLAPLEDTYQTTWSVFPTALKGLLETPSGEPRRA